MAINLTRAWTSQSLVPQAAAMADPSGQTGAASGLGGSFVGDQIDRGTMPASGGILGSAGAVAPAQIAPSVSGTPMGGPTIAQPVFGGGPAGPAGGNSLVNTILSQILGPNYQNLLNGVNNGANGSGGAPASLQDVAALITAQSNASQGYARRNLMENAIMQQGAAQWNAQAGNHLTVANPAGGGLSSPFNPDWVSNQRMQQIYNQSAIQSGQTAAAAASYAPGVQNSVGQQNTGARWNPNTMSGWVSPAQQPFKAGVQSSSPAFSLMSAGI